MASNEPLLQKTGQKKRVSAFYGAEEYLGDVRRYYEVNHEISTMKGILPDESHTRTGLGQLDTCHMLSVITNSENRSHKTGRLFPIPQKPDPMPVELAFLFSKITPEQMLYMWNIITLIFIVQCLMIMAYCAALSYFPEKFWISTLVFGIPFAYLGIQHVYAGHDVMHGATFPPYRWQKLVTHPFADFFSLPWEELVLQHNRHHASTVDILNHGEFGWDPEELQYWMLEWTWSPKKYPFPIHPFGLVLTGALLPVLHFFGLNDTGSIFSLQWYCHFPSAAPGDKCNKEFWTKWFPRRCHHTAFVFLVWACVWLLGTKPLGRDLSEGWRFLLPVTLFARMGYSLAWLFLTNFTHSQPWNEFLATDPERSWPVLHDTMALMLGGKHRWNEILFHDLHHAFPNAVGTLSQRGRFHGWLKVHDAAVDVLHRGLWMDNGDPETDMQKRQRFRSTLMKRNRLRNCLILPET